MESQETLEDPRSKKWKMPTTFPDTENAAKKTLKPCEEPESSRCRSNLNTNGDQKTGEDPISTLEGIILHVTDSELNLSQRNLKEDCTIVKENRKVYLNNNWQVKTVSEALLFKELLKKI